MPDYYRNSKKKRHPNGLSLSQPSGRLKSTDLFRIGSSPLSVRYIFIFSDFEADHPENEYWHENRRKTAYWKKPRNGIK